MRWVVFFILFLGACMRGGDDVLPPISPISVASGDACQASRHEGLVGQDGTTLERIYILGQVRVLRPGRAYDRQMRPARLNFEIDGGGRIARVFCG